MWTYYCWFPLLLLLPLPHVTKELPLARAERPASTIFLPGQVLDNSSSSAALPEAFASVTRCALPDTKLNYRPIIGILSHPGDGASGRLNNDPNASYIAASYVKFVESAGARVIPLIYNEPREILFEKLNLVNGVLFTGGWAKTGLYFDRAREIFEKVLAKNDEGHHFPMYAICLGFEVLSMVISKDNNILEEFSATDQSSTLLFVENINPEGTVFQSEARKSLNRPPTRKVLDNLIYNYCPTYCGKAGKGYDEVYIFT